MQIGDLYETYLFRLSMGDTFALPTDHQLYLAGRFLWRETDNKIIEHNGKVVVLVLGEEIDSTLVQYIEIPDNQKETQEALLCVFANVTKVKELLFSKSGRTNIIEVALACFEESTTVEAVIEYSKLLARIGDYIESHKVLVEHEKEYLQKDCYDFDIALAQSYRRSGYSAKAKSIYLSVISVVEQNRDFLVESEMEVALIDSETSGGIEDAVDALMITATGAPLGLKFKCFYYLGLLAKKKLRSDRSKGKRGFDYTVCEAFLEALKYVQIAQDQDQDIELLIGKAFRSLAKSLLGVFKKIVDEQKKDYEHWVAEETTVFENLRTKVFQPFAYIATIFGLVYPSNRKSEPEFVKHNEPIYTLTDIINVSFEKAIATLKDYKTIHLTIHEEKSEFESLINFHGLNQDIGFTAPYDLTFIQYNAMSSEDMSILDSILHQNKNQRIEFLSERHRQNAPIYNTVPILYVLQHWNSYTPIVPTTLASKGGGYFIDTGSMGIVIDPGFDFIDNFGRTRPVSVEQEMDPAPGFQNGNLMFSDIDTVFVTHAHSDHTADIESLLTILHEYNERVKGDKYSSELSDTVFSQELSHSKNLSVDEFRDVVDRRWASKHNKRKKHLDFYLSKSTFKKYATQLNLNQDNDYQIHLIDSDSGYIEIASNGADGIIPIKAKHKDLMSDRDSLGFIYYTKDCQLVYTGDTGFNEDLRSIYNQLSILETHECEDGKHKTLGMERKVIVLAHIGGFHKSEKSGYLGRRSFSSYYKYHLGRLGLIDLIFTTKPSLCLLSEFGEEFQASGPPDENPTNPDSNRCPRRELCKLLEKEFMHAGFSTAILPADDSLYVRITNDIRVEYPEHKTPTLWHLPTLAGIIEKNGYLHQAI